MIGSVQEEGKNIQAVANIIIYKHFWQEKYPMSVDLVIYLL